jgi:N-acetylmuramoyl-L-alanine amidase
MKKRLLSFILFFAMICGSMNLPVYASALSLRYNGKTVSYTGSQLKVTVNGTSLGISKCPGILMGDEGYAMLPYYETFVKSSIKASKTYYSSTKQLTLSYQSNTLKMTVGSKTAYSNGAKVTLPVAPVTVTYKNSGVTRILVPSRAVASYLGISYSWNSSTKTVALSTKKTSSVSSSQTSGTSFICNGATYSLSRRNVVYNGNTINLNKAPALVFNGYNMVSYYYTFYKAGPKVEKSYSSSTKKLVLTSTVSGNKNILTMTVGSKKATLNGNAVTLPQAPVLIKFSSSGTNLVYVPAKAVGTLLGLSYSYSSSNKTITYQPGLSIKVNNTFSVYTRTQVNIKANGQKVSTAIPGILEENTTLIPAAATFKSTYGLGVTYTYSSNKATFKRGDTTVVVKMNSKNATVNGVTKTMPVAAQKIYLPSKDKNYVMVPGEFVATSLGLGYRYSSGTAYLTSSDSGTGSGVTNSSIEPTITLSRPSSVAKGEITCTDDYENLKLVIKMPGDQTSYYNSNKPSMPSGVTFSTSYSSSKDITSLTFKTTKITGFKVSEDSSHIYIQHGTPTSIFKNVIVLDAGHGGSDSGATANGYSEKDFTLSIVKAAKKYFDKNSDYKVYYTRLSDTYPSLSERYTLANNVSADIFVSVHINDSDSSSAKGTETLYNPDRNKTSSAGLSCYKLATYVQKYVQASTGFSNRGIKERCTRLSNGLAVLNNNNGPATLTEIGFISNSSEAKTMAANLSDYGKAIYDAIVYASNQYPTNR